MQSIEWRPIVGYEGAYEVSSAGRVRSLDRSVCRKGGRIDNLRGVILRPQRSNGYDQVTLSRNGQKKYHRIHRLVALAFHGRALDGDEVCHGDGDKTNNAASNLRWGSRSDNAQDNLNHGTNWQASKALCKQGHEFTPENTKHYPGHRVCIECERLHYLARRSGVTLGDFVQAMQLEETDI